MWQEIIVYIIGAVVAVYVGIKIYKSFTNRNDPCSGCSGCSLKDELEKKRKECIKEKKPHNKCDCGCS